MSLDLQTLKSQWNEILDELEGENRVAWLAYFDGRLVRIENGSLYLDFSDAEKLAGEHNYRYIRKSEHRAALEQAIKKITGVELRVENS
ncbi:MAG: hypothetical protein O2896_01350 [Actinomycetota bacterium]|nr:hypothetical protein [Actinomycetota bacterium]